MNAHPEVIFLILAFAVLNEALIEYLFGSIQKLHPFLPLISLFFAIILTFLYQVDFFALILNIQSSSPFLDILLTGIIVSRLSNYINDFAQKILGSK